MKFSSSLLLTLGSVAAFAPSNKSLLSHQQRSNTMELGLWGEPNQKEGESDKSQSLPFAPRPKLLDGTLAGDVGFE
jgi:hypothetical protein